MCYNHIKYNESKTSATVTAKCRSHNSVSSVSYNWNGEGMQESESYEVDSSFADALSLEVTADDGSNTYSINLEPVNFVWQGAEINQSSVYEGGQKGAIVEMFGWPHADVKEECESLAA